MHSKSSSEDEETLEDNVLDKQKGKNMDTVLWQDWKGETWLLKKEVDVHKVTLNQYNIHNKGYTTYHSQLLL